MGFNNEEYYLNSKIYDHELFKLSDGRRASADLDHCVQCNYTGRGALIESKVISVDGMVHWKFGEFSNYLWLQQYLPPGTVGIVAHEATIDPQPNDPCMWLSIDEIIDKSLYRAPGSCILDPYKTMHRFTREELNKFVLGYTHYKMYNSLRLD